MSGNPETNKFWTLEPIPPNPTFNLGWNINHWVLVCFNMMLFSLKIP